MNTVQHLLPVNLQKYINNFTSSKWHTAFTAISDGKIRSGKLFYSQKRSIKLKSNTTIEYGKKAVKATKLPYHLRQFNKVVEQQFTRNLWSAFLFESMFYPFIEIIRKWMTVGWAIKLYVHHINKEKPTKNKNTKYGEMKRILFQYGLNINTQFEVNSEWKKRWTSKT